MSKRVSATPFIPEETKARWRRQIEQADRERKEHLDAERDRYRLVNAGNLVEDLGGEFEYELKADREYVTRWIKTMAVYRVVLTELEQKAEKMEQADKNHWKQWTKVVVFKRGWLDQLKQPPADVADLFGDAWQPAVNIFLAADTAPDLAATELANLAAMDPGFAMSVGGCLRRGIRPVAEGRWVPPASAPSFPPASVEGEASEPTAERVAKLEGEQQTHAPGEQSNIEQQMARVVQAIGDDTAAEVLVIANQKHRSGEARMIAILRLDRRFAGKDSVEWGTLLGVRPAAVRGYKTWKLLQERKKAGD